VYPSKLIITAIQLYFIGESFRNVKQFLELQGVKMSHVAVYKWIRKYVSVIQNYPKKIKPNVGDAWRTHEIFVKVKGDMKYLYELMDIIKLLILDDDKYISKNYSLLVGKKIKKSSKS
jgi:putative transposase